MLKIWVVSLRLYEPLLSYDSFQVTSYFFLSEALGRVLRQQETGFAKFWHNCEPVIVYPYFNRISQVLFHGLGVISEHEMLLR